MQQEVGKAANYLRSQGIDNATIGIVLGTGLHQLSTRIEVLQSIPYASIPGFSLSTVESHPGKLLYGNIGDKKVLAMQGRFHGYEGYSYDQITFPLKVMKQLGISSLFISNAAGAVNLNYKKGNLMLIEGHIDLQNISGKSNDKDPLYYDSGLKDFLSKTANRWSIDLKKGIYAAVSGPQLETPAEYRFLGRIGADAVGMSTVPEVLEAHKLGIKCCAVSVLTDECDPDNLHPVTLEEIIAVANQSDAVLTELFYQTILQC